MLAFITHPSRRDWLKDLLSLTALLLVFYTFYLGSYPVFTPDEGRYTEVAREMIASGDFVTPRLDGIAFLDKPALYYWLQAFSLSLFGTKEWAIRLFPMLFGILGCLITYICGRTLFNRTTGLFSAVILATSPLYFIGAHYANLDLEVAVLISSCLLCFITAIQAEGPRRRYFLIGAYVSSGLAFLTKGMIGIAFPGIIATLWMVLLGRWEIIKTSRLFLGIAIVTAIILPWYILVQKANPQFLHFFFVTQQVSRFLSAGDFNNKTSTWFYIPVIAIGFFPWTIFFIRYLQQNLRKIWQNKNQHPVILFLLVWIAVVFVFFTIPHSKIATYILPLFAPMALLVGNYLAESFKENKTPECLVFSFVSVIFAIILYSLARYRWVSFETEFVPYLKAGALIYLVGALSALLLIRQKKFTTLFVTAALTSTAFLATITMGAEYLNYNSSKTLVAELKTMLQPQDEVVNYFKFYQDVPLYLARQISLVANWDSDDIGKRDNWVRELWYGLPFQKNSDWLLTEEKFWEHWNSDRRVFVFVNANYFDQFKEHAKSYFHYGRSHDIILLSNKPTISE